VFGVFRGAFGRFYAADGLFLAAGLAFFVLMCMMPLVLLGVSMLGFVLSTQQAANEVVGQLTRNFPVYKAEISRALLHIVETRRLTGVVGTLVLVVFSTPLFGTSRLVLHRLLGVRTRGNVVHNFARDTGMVILLGVLLFLVSVVTWASQWLEEFVMYPARVPSSWLRIAPLGLSLAVSALMFYLAYRYVPRQRMRMGAALAGAVLASVLWEIAKHVFRLYIRRVGLYDQIYGPLGVLIALAMFVYYSAIVFVFGGAYAATRDARRSRGTVLS
jgi:membrane protein